MMGLRHIWPNLSLPGMVPKAGGYIKGKCQVLKNTSFEIKKKDSTHSLKLPSLERKLERGGALHSLRRSIPSSNAQWTQVSLDCSIPQNISGIISLYDLT